MEWRRKGSLVILVLSFLLAGPILAAESPPAPQPPAAPAQPAAPAPAPVQENKPLPPDRYYQLILERQQLIISSNQQILKILEAHPNDLDGAARDLQQHEQERQARIDQLFKKYGITGESYYRSYRGTDAQTERAKYLDAHPEIRDQIANNSKALRAVEDQVRAKMAAMNLVPLPAVPAVPGSTPAPKPPAPAPKPPAQPG